MTQSNTVNMRSEIRRSKVRHHVSISSAVKWDSIDQGGVGDQVMQMWKYDEKGWNITETQGEGYWQFLSQIKDEKESESI